MKSKIKKILRKWVIKTLFPVDQSRGWLPIFQESYVGAFQTDDPVSLGDALSHPTVYACVTQIASDIGKLRLRMTENINGVWVETRSPAILIRPNKFQTRQKFIEYWMISKLTYGNAYILKQRNTVGTVIALYVLDPAKVEPLISENGEIFYRILKDNISKVPKDIEAIPDYEIIHDTMECLFHPLVGVAPLYAANLSVSQGLAMQKNSDKFFENGAQLSGILTAPGHIKKDTAERIKTDWKTNYTGDNAGNMAVLGDGLKYQPLSVSAVDSDLIAQFKCTDEKICSTYKVPQYKIHVGPMPTYQQSETLDRKYYSDCLQRHIESIESLLNHGLSLSNLKSTEFNLEDLMRMDMALKMRTAAEGVKSGILAPNEGRKKFGFLPVKGGDTPYMQQQNYSLAALNERDKLNPLAVIKPEPEVDQTDKALYMLIKKDIAGVKCD